MTAAENDAGVDDGGSVESLERLRRLVSWICVVVFTASFIALLGLSATTYWSPDNRWLLILERAWRVSGLLGLCLWAIPYLARSVHWLVDLFSRKS